MRSIARSVVLAALLLATASVAIAAPHHRVLLPTCSPGTTPFRSATQSYRQTIVVDTGAQVYGLSSGVPLLPQPESISNRPNNGPIQRVYGCAYGHRGAYSLGAAAHLESSKYMETFYGGVAREVLAGPLVAYEVVANQYGCGFCHWGVVVRDLRTGRTLRDEPTGTPVNPALQENFGVGPTTAIVIKADDSVAWIADARAAGGRPSEGGYQVHAADQTGSRLLASGEDIDPHSLALAGSTLYWTQGGKPFSAPLN
jgi:hypothetical protein